MSPRKNPSLALVLLGVLAGCARGGGSSASASRATPASTTAAARSATTTSAAASPSPHTATLAGGTTLPGAGATPSPSPSGPPASSHAPSRFLYTANNGDSSIGIFVIDPATGAPTPTGSVATGAAPFRLVLHPSGTVLYSIELTEITAFAIDPSSGALTPLGSPVVVPGGPTSARTTADGAYLLASYAGSRGGGVQLFAVGLVGDLALVADCALGASAYPFDVAVSPADPFAYVADVSGTIAPLALDETKGTLAPVGSPVASPNVQELAFDGSGRYLVALSSASPGLIQCFSASATGTLAPVGGAFGTGPHAAIDIELGPDGETFYVATANASLVTVSVDAAGNLTRRAVTPVPSPGFPNAVAVDASGRFLYFADFADDRISVLTAGASGLVAGANVPVAPRTAGNPTNPYWVVTAP